MRKWFIDLLSEKKDGSSTGTPSTTRVALMTTLVVWGGLSIASGITDSVMVPPELTHTLWGLLGLKGLTTSAKAIRGSGG